VRKYLAPVGCCDFIEPEGGFYFTLRLKNLDGEKAAEAILRETIYWCTRLLL